MKRLDDGKVSLVEFLRSIKFAHNNTAAAEADTLSRFAHFNPQARSGGQRSVEDAHLIRSAN